MRRADLPEYPAYAVDLGARTVVAHTKKADAGGANLRAYT